MWDVRIGVDDLVGDGLGSTVVALIVVASINVNGETWAAAAVVKAGEGASAVRDAANDGTEGYDGGNGALANNGVVPTDDT